MGVFGDISESKRNTAKLKLFLGKRMPNAPAQIVGSALKNALRLARKPGTTDAKIVAGLQKTLGPFRSGPYTSSGRTSSRLKGVLPQLYKLCPKNDIYQYLDFGCAEGGLTEGFGKAFGLPKARVLGCDVVPVEAKNFTFSLVEAGKPLPYQDKRFQVVTANMSLHHVQDPRAALEELNRVLAPGGVLVIREHDCRGSEIRSFLDAVHYLYAAVINDEVKAESLEDLGEKLPDTVGCYRTADEWTAIIESRGFTHRGTKMVEIPRRGKGSPRPDMFNGYYAFYEKRTPNGE